MQTLFPRMVLASHNRKKTAELRDIVKPLGIDLANLTDFPNAPIPEEDGNTFEENAIIKAAAALSFTGVPSLADDSGLEVDSLGGEPGVHSARFAGPQADDAANNLLLLQRLAGKPAAERRARFVSVVALALPGGEVRTYRGETEGMILETPRGTHGFGYDPLFLSDDLGLTFAEAAPEQKNGISHRRRALNQLVSFLRTRFS